VKAPSTNPSLRQDKLRQRISVPPEVIEVLAEHVQTQLTTPEQIASDLLFPAADGSFLTEHCLRKPFAKVGALIGLEMSFTPRGLRRTFKDLARAASVEALVTKSISGHVTERIREHYSTVHPVEQRESIGAVLRLVKGGAITNDAPRGGTHGGTQGARVVLRGKKPDEALLQPAFFSVFSCRRERFRTYDPYRVNAAVTSFQGVTSRYARISVN
jgi:hypothetical protein